MTTLILIRHGEVAGIHPPTFRGRQDLALTEKGEHQAELTRDYLGERWVLKKIYCSPLSRCVRTADTIAKAFFLDSVSHPGLTDIDYGGWSSLSVKEVEERWPREAHLWKVAPHRFRIPGGESIQDVAARTTDALATILQTHPFETVALVTHDSVVRVLLCHAAGLPLSSYWLFQPSPCGVTVIEADDGFTLQTVNSTQHLLGA